MKTITRLFSVRNALLTVIGVIALSIGIAVYAEQTTYTFPSATFDTPQKRVLTTILNTKADKSDPQFSGEAVFANGKGVSLTTNGAAVRAGIATFVGGTSQVLSTTAINDKSIVQATWQQTNGTSSLGTIAIKAKISNTNFVLAAYTNTAAGVSVVNATATGPVGWSIIQTYP
jgi:hypothetical protein